MVCIKCSANIPDNSIFCNLCGKKQTATEKKHKAKSRGNGSGTVYQRECGSWRAEYTLGYYMKDGKKYRKCVTKSGFKRKKDALDYLEVLKTGSKPKIGKTFADLWEVYKNTKYQQLSKSKQSAYRIAWRKIENELSWKSITDMTVQGLQAVLDKCGNSYYTKHDIKVLLSSLYKIALQDDIVDKNKAQYLQLPLLESKTRGVLTDAEINLLWADYTNSHDSITAHILVMLYTGMRPGEILTAKKDNIDLDQQYLTGGIKTQKGKRRKIIIPDKLVPVVRSMLFNSKSDLLTDFRTKNDFYDAWIAKRTQLGIRQEISPYCCRHTYVTRLTTLKVSPAMLQELAGHEDYDTTLEYTHLSIADRLAEVNRL